MTGARLQVVLASLAIGVLLAACQPGNTKDDDQTGDLGRNQPQSPADIYVNLGLAYMREGQPAVALRKLKYGLELDPRNAQAHNVIAILYQELGDDALAGEHFQRAAALAPKDPSIRNNWGRLLCVQRKFAEADEQFQRALQNPLYESPWVALTNAGICAQLAGDQAAAETYFRQALSANGRFAPALTQMTQLSYQRGDYAAARSFLDRYHQVAGHNPQSLLLAIRLERQSGSPGQARIYEKQLREHFPDAPEIVQLNR